MKKKFEGELLGCLPEAGAVLAADERIETRPEKHRFLGLPERFLIKPPSDGLTGKTDEDNLGFTYHAVNEYIRKGEVDPAIKEQIDRKHKVSRFKFQTLPVYQNGLPIVLPEETDYYNPNKK